MAETQRLASGTSTSSTPGTLVCEIERTGSNTLCAFDAFALSGGAANSFLTLTITYTDETTTTVSTESGATSDWLVANRGGILSIRVGGNYRSVTAGQNKAVKKVSILTSGTGTDTRAGTIQAIETDESPTLLRAAGVSSSGTPGTAVADVSRSASNELIDFSAWAVQTGAANTQYRILETYTDDTTAELTCTVAGSRNTFLNFGGLIERSSAFSAFAEGSTEDTKQVRVETANTGTGDRAAIAAATEVADASALKRASGSSSSTTDGTLVAELEATAGTRLIAWQCMTAQTQAAATQTRTIITYTDDTTSEDTTAANSNSIQFATAGGILRANGNDYAALVAGENKDVKKIRVETESTGSGTRYAVIQAREQAIPGGSGQPVRTMHQNRMRAA